MAQSVKVAGAAIEAADLESRLSALEARVETNVT
jgi:hypothetical protein